MLKQIGRVVTAAMMVGLLITSVAAQEPLGFTIDPTQGLPGDVVSGQVDPADVAAECVTTVEGLQEVFRALLNGPFVGAGTEGELPQRFFPDPNNIVYDDIADMAYVLTLAVVLGIAENIEGATETALPQTFVMTFADLLTQEPLGELGSFDPVTGEGSVVVPDLPCGPQAVVATCVEPVFDIDLLEAGIREGAEFLESIGLQFGPEGIFSEEFLAFAREFLNTDIEDGFQLLIMFAQAVGPDLLQPIMTPDALGIQIFNVLCVPQTKDECKNGGWQQFNQPPPGLGFKNQGQCVAFVETGMFVGTANAAVP